VKSCEYLIVVTKQSSNFGSSIQIMFRYIAYFTLILVSLSDLAATGQSNFNFKLNTLGHTFNPVEASDGGNLQLNGAGTLVLQPGLILSYEKFIVNKFISIRVNQGFLLNELQQSDGLSGLSAHISVYKRWKTAINFGLGFSTLYSMDDMDRSSFSPVAALELNYFLSKETDLSFAINNTYHEAINLSIGMRYWISKDHKKSFKCNTCPDF
jgi:hypothetical protein